MEQSSSWEASSSSASQDLDWISWVFRGLGGKLEALYEQGIIVIFWKRIWKSSIGNRIFCTPQNSTSSSESRVFFSDGMSYIVLSGLWCDIGMNAHAPARDEGDGSKASSFKELERTSGHFRNASTYIAKVWVFCSAVTDSGTFYSIGPKTRAYEISRCIRPFISHVDVFELFHLRCTEVVIIWTTFILRTTAAS
jgi:hypothetical protein